MKGAANIWQRTPMPIGTASGKLHATATTPAATSQHGGKIPILHGELPVSVTTPAATSLSLGTTVGSGPSHASAMEHVVRNQRPGKIHGEPGRGLSIASTSMRRRRERRALVIVALMVLWSTLEPSARIILSSKLARILAMIANRTPYMSSAPKTLLKL